MNYKVIVLPVVGWFCLMLAGLFVAGLIVASTVPAHAQSSSAVPSHTRNAKKPESATEGEVKFGATLFAVTTNRETKSYPGFGFGAGANFPLTASDIGMLYASFSCNIGLGAKPAATSFDLQSMQIPLGVMFKIGENIADGRRFIGGAIGAGACLSFGPFDDNGVDFRPYISADIILALFERGALKIRYFTLLGNYVGKNQGIVTQHALYLIASTEW
ncbi:MAG: hypothetical protein HQ472_07130 [Ignavibacteria bacterium]|nr:hypothetical protein [Ignavibacteria bacterium]